MAPDTTPEGLRDTRLRSSVWGVDRLQAEGLLAEAASRIETLEEMLAKAKAAPSDDKPDLTSEFDAVGTEVSAILQAAREAAEAMRERASMDAARWRTEAIAEAEERRRESASDAEAMRRDAWATGTQLIEQAQAHAIRITEQADRDVLTVMGEAEREAHRLTSAARRDAEDLVRNATMTSEKMTAEAVKRRDEIIDAATRQASVAQERTLALEKRRDELLEELEHARSTLSQLEASLDERQEYMSPSSTVRVVQAPSPSPGSEGQTWVSGETVRVVKPEPRKPQAGEGESDVATEPTPSVLIVRPETQPAAEPEPESGPEQEPERETPVEPVAEIESGPDPQRVPVSQPDPEDSIKIPDPEVDSLFASLRGGGSFEAGEAASDPAAVVELGSSDSPVEVSDSGDDHEDPDPENPDQESTGDMVAGHDWSEERDTRLLPITNRALRGVKKSITELQNIALDNLRTDAKWRPDPSADSELLSADLVTMWGESFAAGHAVAEQMSDGKLKRPTTPSSTPVEEFPASLSSAVAAALDSAGEGQRERQSAASRVYRVWRSDEADQKIRDLAMRAYRLGIELSTQSSD